MDGVDEEWVEWVNAGGGWVEWARCAMGLGGVEILHYCVECGEAFYHSDPDIEYCEACCMRLDTDAGEESCDWNCLYDGPVERPWAHDLEIWRGA